MGLTGISSQKILSEYISGCLPNGKREVVLYEVSLLIVLSGDFIFILQSLTTSKMSKCQTIRLSQLHKAKTWWTENLLSSLTMVNNELLLRAVFSRF